MEFILTYRTNDSQEYETMTICGGNLASALFDYEGSDEDIISIVRVF